MDLDTDLQNPAQNSPQQQAQTSPPPGDPSPASPTVPEITTTPRPPLASDTDVIDTRTPRERNKKLRDLSKTFGQIPDVPIFTQWDSRMECSNSAVHRSIMAGICGNGKDGAYSVALSCLYKDDEDGGEVIIYTGAGGRKQWTDAFPPKRLRLGPQVEDQSWDKHSNKALMVSFCTGNPVRLIRSWRCPSQYAPLQGYRYDGLYKVAACWTGKGLNGKKICRCRLERLPGQPPIPVRPITFHASRKRLRERLVSRLTPNPLTSTNDVDIEPNQTNASPVQSAGGTERESVGSPNPPQQREIPENSTMDEMDLDVKLPQAPSHQPRDPPDSGVLPTYKWVAGRQVLVPLVRLPTSRAIQEDIDIAEGDEEEHRGEDDATLVPSEDGHVYERMETEY